MSSPAAFGGSLGTCVEALRQKVLDAAVRGELTEQVSEDGTAKDLLMQIASEKERLIREGEIKKEKAQPEISKEEKPFEIPKNWEWVRLGEICSKLTDGAHQVPPDSKKGYPVISAKDIVAGEISLKNVGRYVCEDDFIRENNRTHITKGDVILGIIGGSIGKTAIYSHDVLVIAQRSIAIIDTLIINCFVRRVLESPLFTDYFQECSSGTAQGGVYLSKLSSLPFPLPPLAEQHRIVEKVESIFHQLDELKTLQTAYASNLEALRKKVIEEGVRGNLTERLPDDGTAADLLKEIAAERAALVAAGKMKKEKPLPAITEEEKPFEIPESWEWVRITDIARCELGKTKDSGKNTGEYFDYLCSINVYDGVIDISNIKQMRFEPEEFERFQVKKGDLLICEGGDAGRCAVWDKEVSIFYQNALHRVRFYKNLNPYFYMYIMHLYKTDNILSSASTGVTIQHLTLNALKKLCFPLPPLAEQQRIVEKIEGLMKIIDGM